MKIIKTANGKKKIKISKSEWTNIGKKAGWMKTSQVVKAFTWIDDYKGSGTWDIDYKDIKPEDLYYKDGTLIGKSKSDKDIMKEMIQSITNIESGEKLSMIQIDHFIKKLMTTDEFFDLVQEANQLYGDEQRIEQRDIDTGLIDIDEHLDSEPDSKPII